MEEDRAGVMQKEELRSVGSPSAGTMLPREARAGRDPGPAPLVLLFPGLASKLPAQVPCGPQGKLRPAGAEPKEGSGLSPVTLQVLRSWGRTGRPFISQHKETLSQLHRDQARSPQTLGHNISGNFRGLFRKVLDSHI